ncbi:reverse transcriptase domain-containing protein [Citrus sinensis]|nr:reverse transcriptase domain-containing protein [Citrus sinensis]
MDDNSENLRGDENPNFDGAFPPPFRETRTIKKARFRDEENDSETTKQVSYKETLVNSSQAMENGFRGGEVDWDFEEGDMVEHNDGSMPSINFSDRVHAKLSEPWKHSVVVKLLGRNIGYKTLCTRLHALWRTAMTYSVIDLENNYFLIRFRSARDAVDALTNGPWIIMGHYLTVQPWSPSFDFTKTVLDQVTVWIRLPGLAVHLYNQKILQKLGQMVGTVIKIDPNIASSTRGRFARLAVSVSLDKPLVSQFELDGRIQKVEYEDLPVICFSCGRYDHNSNNCKISATERKSDNVVQPPSGVQSQKDPASSEANRDDDTMVEPFGPWMIVTRKGRKPNNGQNHEPNGVSESRFHILAQMSDLHENPVHEASTDVPSTSKQPSPYSLNPIFTFNNDKIIKPPVRRQQNPKTAASKPQTRKPSTPMNPTRNPFQTAAYHVRGKNIISTPHANPSQIPCPTTHVVSNNQQAPSAATTLDPTKHTVVFYFSQIRPYGDMNGVGTEHRDREELDPQHLADPLDGHSVSTTNAFEHTHTLFVAPMSGDDGQEISDEEVSMVQESPLVMMDDIHGQ